MVERGEERRPLVARWGGITLARNTKAVLDDAPLRICGPRTELEQRLLANTCELCGSQDSIQVHHVRALKDLQRRGRAARPHWVEIMAARRRKTLVDVPRRATPTSMQDGRRGAPRPRPRTTLESRVLRKAHARFGEGRMEKCWHRQLASRLLHFVICCRPGKAEAALARMQALMTRLGLEVNTAKTRIARLPGEGFDFLGYTVGRFYGKDGRAYIGTRPSQKSVKSLLGRIHERTTPQWHSDTPESTVARLSSMLRGWCGYFDQGPVMDIYDRVRDYTERRVRRWLMRRTGRRGIGFGQIPDEYLYGTLGLYRVPARRDDLPRAKA